MTVCCHRKGEGDLPVLDLPALAGDDPPELAVDALGELLDLPDVGAEMGVDLPDVDASEPAPAEPGGGSPLPLDLSSPGQALVPVSESASIDDLPDLPPLSLDDLK